MQPFDALSIRAVLNEARPLIVNRKVDKISQLGRDELVITLRGKSGLTALFASAQSVHGRICLLQPNSLQRKSGDRPDPASERYVSKYGANSTVPNFCLLLRKHLSGATLIAAEQPLGERIVDLVFSAVDEVGTSSIKVLTAEIMGRHSNLIFWDKASGKIITASHLVTRDMSRQREVAPALKYERPPSQDRPSLYTVSGEDFLKLFDKLKEQGKNGGAEAETPGFATLEQWIIATFTGAGRHLCEELVLSAGLESEIGKALNVENAAEKLWQTVESMRKDGVRNPLHKPLLFKDLSRYSVLGTFPHKPEEVKTFPSVNDLIEEYFRTCEHNEQVNQLRERLKADLSLELSKLESRVKTASEHVQSPEEIDSLKRSGDLILANLTSISAGQEVLLTENIFVDNGGQLSIKLNPNLTVSQNAQHYYRQYAKVRARNSTASRSIEEAQQRRQALTVRLQQVLEARDIYDLKQIKEGLSGKKPQDIVKPRGNGAKGKGKNEKIISVNSSDGWTIYVGRNRMENDYLLSRLAQPNDLWFHVLGQGGAHVLIRIPSSKQDPPARTLEEAGQIAARFSKAGHGAKVRVIYTQCKYVRKLAGDKPGLVRYENEKSLEIDTGKPMPKAMKQLFAPGQ